MILNNALLVPRRVGPVQSQLPEILEAFLECICTAYWLANRSTNRDRKEKRKIGTGDSKEET